MATGNEGEATFRISIDGNASDASKDISSSARLASKAIAKFESEAKALSADLRRLKGNSDDVKVAKEGLKKRIDETKQSVSTLTKELAKQGTTYTAAAAAAKKYGDGVGRLPNLRAGASKAVGLAGKGIDLAAQKIGGKLDPVAKKLGGALSPIAKKLGTALAPAAKRIGGAFAPVGKKISTALAPAGRAISKYTSGAAKAIGGLGKAVKEDVSSVLPSLSSALGLVASGSAIAAAAIAAVGVAAVAGAAALVAFGLSSSDAAARMSRQREALLGSASDAKAFGEQIASLAGKVPQSTEELNGLAVSLSKTRLTGKAMVSTFNAVAQATGAVDAQAGAKIQELLTRGQNVGRFALQRLELQGTGIDFDDVAKEYAAGTKKSLAAARKELMIGAAPLEAGAAAVAKATEKKFGALNIKNAFSLENAPKKFVEQFRLLSSGINLEPLSRMFQSVFGQLSPDAPLGKGVKTLMETVGNGFVDVAVKSIPVLLEGFKWLLAGALKVATFFYVMKKAVKDAFAAEGWVGVGKAMVDGLIRGFTGRNEFLASAVKSMAGTVKDAFTGKLEIHSPSKVFERYGANTVEGYAQGVDRGSSRASGAVESMVQTPSALSGATTTPAIGSIEVHIHGAPVGDMQAMQSPEFLAAITRALRAALSARGLAT